VDFEDTREEESRVALVQLKAYAFRKKKEKWLLLAMSTGA